MMKRYALVALLIAACGDDTTMAGDGGGPDPGEDAGGPGTDGGYDPPKNRECKPIYAQDTLPTFEIEIAESEWAEIVDEYTNWQAREAAGLDVKPYHPLISFSYDGMTASDAVIRLRGNPCCSWTDPKMQFQISFNENNEDGRFMGMRKILLDAPRYNRSFLKERLALHYLRDMGIPAPCANNARLVVNGQYYGLYTNLEKVDREFLERNFEDPDGDLFKKGYELKTNEDTSNLDRMNDYHDAATDLAALEAMLDVPQWISEWTAEAMVPDNDGFWGGGGNFYIYDDPKSGRLLLIPWDWDSTFDILPSDTDPVTWIKPDAVDGRPVYDTIMAKAEWRQLYVDTLREAAAMYDVDAMQALVDEWSEQIRDAAYADPNKQFTNESHDSAVENLREYLPQRKAFIESWLSAQ